MPSSDDLLSHVCLSLCFSPITTKGLKICTAGHDVKVSWHLIIIIFLTWLRLSHSPVLKGGKGTWEKSWFGNEKSFFPHSQGVYHPLELFLR